MDIKIHTYLPPTCLPLNTPYNQMDFSKNNVYKVVRTISGVGEHTTVAHLLTTLAESFNTSGLWCMAVQDPIMRERRLKLLRGKDKVLVVMEKMRRRMELWAFVKEDVMNEDFSSKKIQPLNFKKKEFFGNNDNTQLNKEALNFANESEFGDLNMNDKNSWKVFNDNVKESEFKWNGNTENINNINNYTKHNIYHDTSKTKYEINNSKKFDNDGKNYIGTNESINCNQCQFNSMDSLQYNTEINHETVNSDGNNSRSVKLSSGNQRNQPLLPNTSENDLRGDHFYDKVMTYELLNGKNLSEKNNFHSKLNNQGIIDVATSNDFDHYKIDSINHKFNKLNHKFVNNENTDINNNRIEPIKNIQINNFFVKNNKNIKKERKHEINKETPEINSNAHSHFDDKNVTKNCVLETKNEFNNYKIYNGVNVTTINTKTKNYKAIKTDNTNNVKYDERSYKNNNDDRIFGISYENKELIIDNRKVCNKENNTDENEHNNIINNKPDIITDNNKDNNTDGKTQNITDNKNNITDNKNNIKDNKNNINISTETYILKDTNKDTTTDINKATTTDTTTDIHTYTNTDTNKDIHTDTNTDTNTDIHTDTNTDIHTDIKTNTQIISSDLQERLEKQRLCLSMIHVEIEKVLIEKQKEIQINEELENEEKSLDEKLCEVQMVDWSEQRDIYFKRTNQGRERLFSVKESVQSAMKDLEEVKENVEKLQIVVMEMEGQDVVIDKQCQKWNEICHKRQTEQDKSLNKIDINQ